MLFPKKNLQFIFTRWTMTWRFIIIIIIITIIYLFIYSLFLLNLSLVSSGLGMIYSILRPTKYLKTA